MEILLQACGATKTYPGNVHALREVDLEVRRGETVALIGESGCGKTTLLRLFNRMVEPTSGEVIIGRIPARKIDPIALRRRTGYVQQEGGLLPHWTVARNVALVPGLLGWDPDRRESRTAEMLALVGLDFARVASRHPHELSGGQRQRVAVARALAADPEVILLDEPFGALDAITRVDLQEEFLRLRAQLVKTMLLVTHDLEEAFRLGDRIGVLREGRLLRLASPEDLLRDPGDPYVADLIAHHRGVRS